MARGHARIKTTIWKDETFTARTPEAQRVYFMLLSQPGLSFCGVIDYTGRRWAALAKGTTAKTIAKAVEELAAANFLVLDEDHEELWVRSFVRHDGVLSGGPKLLSAMWKDFAAIASPMLRQRFLDSLPPEIRDGAPDGVSDTPSDGASDDPSDTEPPEDAMPHPMPRGRARPLPSSPLHPAPAPPDVDKSSSNLDSVGAASVEEELQETANTAAMLVAKRRLETRDGPPITNPTAWLARTAAGVMADHGAELRAGACSGLAGEGLADLVMPRPAHPYPIFEPEPDPDEPLASVNGLATVRSALGGGA